ncbi:hypothetical protein SLEP1_g56658 [Rubroshorea leprosula]|uniref:Uncharacterized protein n=1 Tax=Rubroshorea leprosula TaxID=152421 RepID=A0AAV5MK97_9ROSI|nr:hypothetical protein SLEP1_g56658 [Rubroshorea leprosula]
MPPARLHALPPARLQPPLPEPRSALITPPLPELICTHHLCPNRAIPAATQSCNSILYLLWLSDSPWHLISFFSKMKLGALLRFVFEGVVVLTKENIFWRSTVIEKRLIFLCLFLACFR